MSWSCRFRACRAAPLDESIQQAIFVLDALIKRPVVYSSVSLRGREPMVAARVALFNFVPAGTVHDGYTHARARIESNADVLDVRLMRGKIAFRYTLIVIVGACYKPQMRQDEHGFGENIFIKRERVTSAHMTHFVRCISSASLRTALLTRKSARNGLRYFL